MHTLLNTSFLFMSLMVGCKDNGVDAPPPLKVEKKWEEISLFNNADIRYMTQHNGVLYVSTYTIKPTGNEYILYKTDNGIKWDTLKIFDRYIGPLAFNRDTLTVLENGRTWKYHPTFGWKMFWEHLIAADQTYDMFWLNDELFVYANYMRKVFSQDTVRDVIDPPNYSKFVKHSYKGEEIVYTRSYYVYEDRIYRFNGYSFETVMNGISLEENKNANYPSMCVNNDTFYAGFNTPTRIKKLTNDLWVNVTDTIPNTSLANIFTPNLRNRSTSIVFHKNRMFVGTEWTGVIEWTDSGWVSIANGLQLAFPNYPQYTLYTAVVQMESFKGRLFVAYGEQFSAPVVGGRGISTYTLE